MALCIMYVKSTLYLPLSHVSKHLASLASLVVIFCRALLAEEKNESLPLYFSLFITPSLVM